MTVSSKPVVLIVMAFLVATVVGVVHSSSLKFSAFALVDECTSNGTIAGITISLCCHNSVDDKGNTKKYCALCTQDQRTVPYKPITCGPYYESRVTLGGVLNPSGNVTKAQGNNTLTLGNIIKVPPDTTPGAAPTDNNTGTLPTLTITKGNATNPSNNTGPIKLSPLTGQHQQTSAGPSNNMSTPPTTLLANQPNSNYHGRGGSTSSVSNTNSTGH